MHPTILHTISEKKLPSEYPPKIALLEYARRTLLLISIVIASVATLIAFLEYQLTLRIATAGTVFPLLGISSIVFSLPYLLHKNGKLSTVGLSNALSGLVLAISLLLLPVGSDLLLKSERISQFAFLSESTLESLTYKGLFLIGSQEIPVVPIPIPTPSVEENLESSTSSCAGADIMVLLDLSVSMHTADSDYSLSNSIRFLIDRAGNHVLYTCPDITHRLSVVGFGLGGIVPFLDSVQISPTLSDFAMWKLLRSELTSLIPVAFKYYPATDYFSAFESAQLQLKEWSDEPLDDTARISHIILITDGIPYCDNSLESCEGSLTDLEDYLSPENYPFPLRSEENRSNVKISVVLIPSQSPFAHLDREIYDFWENTAKIHNGSVIVSQSQDEPQSVNPSFFELIDSVLPAPEPTPFSGKYVFFVEPYVSNTVLLRFLIPESSRWPSKRTILSYEGTHPPFVVTNGIVDQRESASYVLDYIVDGPTYFLVLSSPPPGKYTLELDGFSSETAVAYYDHDIIIGARVQETPIGANINSPLQGSIFEVVGYPPHYSVENSQYFSLSLYTYEARASDQYKAPLMSDPDYPIEIVAHITRADDTVQDLSLFEQADGFYESLFPIEFPSPGTYEWSVTFSYPSVESGDRISFYLANGTFEVTDGP